MQRRNFIKSACRICLLGATAATSIDLAGCSPGVANSVFKPDITDNNIQVPLNIFDKTSLQIISPKKYPYEVAIEKKQDGTYKALLLKCTHYANQLTPTGNGFTCNAHGSRFDKEGKVLKGPAAEPLPQLQTAITEQYLSIHLLK